MLWFLRQASLKTVELDFEGEYKITNVDSRVVSRIHSVFNNIHLGKQRSGYFGSSRDLYKDELDTISFFRGFTPDINFNDNKREYERDKADYFQKFFIVGEKGKAYRENVLSEGIEPYFNREPCMDDINELLELINSILRRNSFGSIEIETISPYVKEDIMGIYMFLLNLVHNIGGRWDNKCRSPFVSAAYGRDGYKKALNFAQGRNGRRYSYIIMGFIRKTNVVNYILTKELSEKLGMLDVDWYQDIHSEIIIKDGIFPHNILGVFEIDNETGDKSFIINPYLYQLFDVSKKRVKYRSRDLTEYICHEGIPVNQDDFDNCARSLGYRSYGYRIHDGYTFAGEIDGEADLPLPRNRDFW
ncbi:hypothetical protein JZO81_02830 [Enterococcus hulanensis]|nr:hypothetical protein [Enterococcus hulanensis]MBO0409971.1 hypothetical protein [Enterococcus hulanensis]